MPKGLMLTDLAIAGLLLIVAKVIRVHTPLLQRMYIHLLYWQVYLVSCLALPCSIYYRGQIRLPLTQAY